MIELPRVVPKPWGCCMEFFRDDRTVFKTMRIDPGKRTSLQSHCRRNEFWVVLGGTGLLTLRGKDRPLKAGDHVTIYSYEPHRVLNIGMDLLIIAETQYGESCREDDIVRHEDDYGRAA